jgi:hypothetical protein
MSTIFKCFYSLCFSIFFPKIASSPVVKQRIPPSLLEATRGTSDHRFEDNEHFKFLAEKLKKTENPGPKCELTEKKEEGASRYCKNSIQYEIFCFAIPLTYGVTT